MATSPVRLFDGTYADAALVHTVYGSLKKLNTDTLDDLYSAASYGVPIGLRRVNIYHCEIFPHPQARLLKQLGLIDQQEYVKKEIVPIILNAIVPTHNSSAVGLIDPCRKTENTWVRYMCSPHTQQKMDEPDYYSNSAGVNRDKDITVWNYKDSY